MKKHLFEIFASVATVFILVTYNEVYGKLYTVVSSEKYENNFFLLKI